MKNERIIKYYRLTYSDGTKIGLRCKYDIYSIESEM